jgi:hypothetical protein
MHARFTQRIESAQAPGSLAGRAPLITAPERQIGGCSTGGAARHAIRLIADTSRGHAPGVVSPSRMGRVVAP